MPTINRLSPHIANLIAAGEVVERPASVVKELLENAVDAGATSVTVEIQNGGMTLLRLSDNGCGMDSQDAKTAFLRHATSKLKTAEDLGAIATMGFRGEALAAVASVSRIDLLTATKDAQWGTSLHLEGGTVTESEDIGAPVGTTIMVRDLFFNTPARMKFMKSDSAESAAVLSVVQRQALSHPDLSIRFIKDGQTQLTTPGDGQLQSAIYAVFGRQFALDLLPVASKWEKIAVDGFTTKPTASRGNRTMQTFFVNNRPVKSRLLSAAVEQAYQNMMMTGRFPGCVLHITLPEAAVDVNVHPAKTEVKFLREREVFDAVHYGILGVLNRKIEKPDVKLPTPKPAEKPAVPVKNESFFQKMDSATFQEFVEVVKKPATPTPTVGASFARPQISETPQTVVASPIMKPKTKSEMIASTADEQSSPLRPADAGKADEQSSPLRPADAGKADEQSSPLQTEEPSTQVEIPLQTQEVRLIGEAMHTYLIAEMGETVYFIDKHAAHERILFEKLQAQKVEIMSQLLLAPIPVKLEPCQANAILEHLDTLQSFGLVAEEFGIDTIILRQIPDFLDETKAALLVEELAEALSSGQKTDPKALRAHVHHSMACKAAIKGGWNTNPVEQLALAKEVLARDDIKFCPHGRPITIQLTKKELEKQFKRA